MSTGLQQQQAAVMASLSQGGLYGGLWKSASQQAQEALAQATAADRAKGGIGLTNMQRRQFLANFGQQSAQPQGQTLQPPSAQTMAPTGDAYGQEISKETGLPVGTPGPTQQPAQPPGQPAPQPGQVPGQQPGAPPPQTGMPGPGGQPMPGLGQSAPMQGGYNAGGQPGLPSDPNTFSSATPNFGSGSFSPISKQQAANIDPGLANPPSFKQGGRAPYTGAFKLHKDEVVLPNGCPMCGRPL